MRFITKKASRMTSGRMSASICHDGRVLLDVGLIGRTGLADRLEDEVGATGQMPAVILSDVSFLSFALGLLADLDRLLQLIRSCCSRSSIWTDFAFFTFSWVRATEVSTRGTRASCRA